MLILKQIKKDYHSGDTFVHALNGIDIEFRKNEFVSILGPSGCGKTTLLNIIGGLDQYTEGDLIINGKSTKQFKDSDWDTYRNHSIGFVFQNYNLIPHQTVLSNVELALTLSGISKTERRKRALEVLEKVGLGDQINKKPNQMSGGQMQRVAIARALINDPDILLADEPTGALDSATSVQIMELLKGISKDKLIIMVTHNPELAKKYSSRIVRLLDGKIIDDSNPYHANLGEPLKKSESSKQRKTSMSFLTALSLSLNNLMTKKARTFLTAFAGSIGIIGIALILSLSHGVQVYIDHVQEDTLSSYPLSIESISTDINKLMASMAEVSNREITHDMEKVHADSTMVSFVTTMMADVTRNDLKSFKSYLESKEEELSTLCSDIQYSYSTQMNIYQSDVTNGITQVNPGTVFRSMGYGNPGTTDSTMGMDSSKMAGMSGMPMMPGMSGVNIFSEILDNEALITSQYHVIAGHMPQDYSEVVLIVDENNELDDYTLYTLGIKDQKELPIMMQSIMNGEEITIEPASYTYEDLLSLTFKLVVNTDYFEKQNGIWVDHRMEEEYIKKLLDSAIELKVVGILRPSEEASATSISGAVGYKKELMEHLIEAVNSSEIVKEQKENPTVNIFTGKPFTPESTYENNLALLGATDLDNPSGINIYPVDFAAKERITDLILEYNNTMKEQGKEEYIIQYTDYIGLMMSSVSLIINSISYVLIAFVAISLVVSSIMIGIITYISVLERTKEIGILRSIGASKRDISRVFNAETLIVGFVAGALGIGISLLLTIPINLIIRSITDVPLHAALPILGGLILVAISMLLTFIAGLIPSRIAAKKDPVVALRTE